MANNLTIYICFKGYTGRNANTMAFQIKTSYRMSENIKKPHLIFVRKINDKIHFLDIKDLGKLTRLGYRDKDGIHWEIPQK